MPKGELLKLFKDGSKPTDQKTVGKRNSVKGSNNVIVMDSQSVNINVHHKPVRQILKVIKSSEHIDDHTAYKIKELVDNIVNKEVAGGATSQKAYAKWYGSLKKRYKVTSYTLIPAHLGNEAISWLQQQAAIKRTKIRRNNTSSWRTEHYSAIYARSGNLGISKGELYNIVLSKFNKRISSLSQLSDVNLQKLYQYIMGL